MDQLLTKMMRLAPVESERAAPRASANLDRALAAIAYGELRAALQLFRCALKRAPWFLARDKRTWILGAALLSACILPTRIHQRAEHC